MYGCKYHIEIIDIVDLQILHTPSTKKHTQVPSNLTPEGLQEEVEQIKTINALTFTEDEIPKGMDTTHIFALYITIFINY